MSGDLDALYQAFESSIRELIREEIAAANPLITRSGVAGASSVGDGPACCGDPARPGHPNL